MKSIDEEFFKKLCATFQIEGKDRVNKISSTLLELENTSDIKLAINCIETIYREIHSLKSAARAVKIIPIENVCQKMESLFFLWKTKNSKPTISQFDLLHQAVNFIEDFFAAEDIPAIDTVIFDNLLHKLDITLATETKAQSELNSNENINIFPEHAEALPIPPSLEKKQKETSMPNQKFGSLQKTIRISTSKLDSVLNQAEGMIATKINLAQRISDIALVRNNLLFAEKELEKIIPDQILLRKKIEQEFNHQAGTTSQKKILEYLNTNEKYYKILSDGLEEVLNKLEQNHHNFGMNVDNLLQDSKNLLLWPFSSLLDTLPRTVREISRELNKQVNLKIEGGELEIDKRILEEMKDVLLHMVRNSIVHGLESPEQRKKQGKSETGIIQIHIHHMSGNEIQIIYTDDGGGVPLYALKQAAVEQGILGKKEAEQISDHDASQLIFQSGLSTSSVATELSGRGLGMSIIREKIENIGGKISLETKENQGTTFRIKLPLTLATFKGLLIELNAHQFIIPTSNIERIIRISKEKIKSIENRETIAYADEIIPLIYLSDILKISKKDAPIQNEEKIYAIVLTSTENKIAFVVDDIINEQEILVKHFEKPLIRIQYIAAAAILGSGKPVPILNTKDLLQIQTLSPRRELIKQEQAPEINMKRILLAEDSITTRMLIKNILELEGFEVIATADGLEAWEKLNESDFDAVVSDIEMPRMSGFELTERIRHDTKLKDIPIILVTALSSDKDRERGIDLGANAYVIKSTFDSKHLIEVINRVCI